MIKNLSSSIEDITPQKAEYWLTFNYEHQRRLRNYHVRTLSEQMAKGLFMPTVTIHFCLMNGNSYLINGQHTLNAIIKSGCTLNGFNVVKTSVDTEDELAQMYMTYDINTKRTIKDAIHSLDLPKIYNLTITDIENVCRASEWIERGFTYKNNTTVSNRKMLSYEEIIYLGIPWFEELKNIKDFISPCSREIRNKIFFQGVLCIALITARHRPEEAKYFWQQVAQDDGLKKDDPRKALHTWLYNYNDSPKYNGYVHINLVPRAVAKFWNKFMTNELVSKIVIPKNSSEKIELVGIEEKTIYKYVGTILG